MIPRWLGWLWLVAGVVGVAASVAVASFGVAFIGSTTQAGVDALDVTRDLLETVGATTDTVEETVTSVTEGLGTLEQSVVDGAATLRDVSRLSADLGELATSTIPESLDALRATMPQLIATAGVVDGVMRTLRFVGVDYDPEVPLDGSLVELDLRLAVIPDQLRSQAAGFDEAAQGIADFGAASIGIASDIGTISDNLAGSSELLTGYTEQVGEAVAVLDSIEAQIVDQSAAARVIVLILGVALALGQTVPIAAGLWVVRSNPS
ncbi:MAG: hypothetical protein ACFCVC_14320 [Acidimicrobiia bacterium]